MKMLQISAQTLPLFVSKPGEKTPFLCGSIPADSSYVAKPGDIVAALVKGLEHEDSWILAEIVSFNANQNKYEVDDIDETKDRHVLSKRRSVYFIQFVHFLFIDFILFLSGSYHSL